MIRIYAEHTGDRCRLFAQGHAEPGAERDAVCAGVSALTGALILHARAVGARYLRYHMRPGEIFFSCREGGECFELVLRGLRAIAGRYPEHVKISAVS
jgi:uncharacterized protein YsxB (DUF464 family)